ncbi:Ger(x)C family spore germination protein [Lysinibacillus halotolerans]|nr:Ger(x)C family spore germination protein [Lysinibacillus halotolerans]
MKRIMLFSLFLFIVVFLSGCGGVKNIQDLTYIVAIGMDYDQEKNEYIVYLQGLNFANVAKQEGARPTEKVPIFVGRAEGETLNLAISELYNKTENDLFLGHVSALVLSDKIVTHKFNEVIEEINRNRSLSSTLQIVTTEEEIEDVLNVEALFNYPPIYTILFKKFAYETARDELKPVTLMEFLKTYYEPMGMAKIPSVKLDDTNWMSEGNYTALYFNGYSVFQNEKYVQEIEFNDALFLTWLTEDKVTLNYKVKNGEELVANVEFLDSKMNIHYEKGTDSPQFSVELSANVDLLEKLKDIPIDEVIKLIEEDLKEKFISLYQKGVENQLDVLNIGEKWYRIHPKAYKKLEQSYTFYLNNNSLKNVKVDVNIIHFNTYKYEVER